MAYVESHQEVGQHPKLLRLARTLQISEPEAVGHLHYLWWWALDYAPDGHIVGYDTLDLAVGARWEGDPDKFVQALIDAGGAKDGWLELRDDGWFIHDWPEFGGKLHAKKLASAKANHTRHHTDKGVTAPDCQFCASDRTPNPLRPDSDRTSELPPTGLRMPSDRTPDALRPDSKGEESREEKKERYAPAGATDMICQAVAVHIETRDGTPPARQSQRTWELEAVNLTTIEKAKPGRVRQVLNWIADGGDDNARYWRDENPISSVRDLRQPDGRWERLCTQQAAATRDSEQPWSPPILMGGS